MLWTYEWLSDYRDRDGKNKKIKNSVIRIWLAVWLCIKTEGNTEKNSTAYMTSFYTSKWTYLIVAAMEKQYFEV